MTHFVYGFNEMLISLETVFVSSSQSLCSIARRGNTLNFIHHRVLKLFWIVLSATSIKSHFSRQCCCPHQLWTIQKCYFCSLRNQMTVTITSRFRFHETDYGDTIEPQSGRTLAKIQNIGCVFAWFLQTTENQRAAAKMYPSPIRSMEHNRIMNCTISGARYLETHISASLAMRTCKIPEYFEMRH